MFYRIFLYKMFASSIFYLLLLQPEIKIRCTHIQVCKLLYGRKAHSRAAHEQIVKLAHYFYINQLRKKIMNAAKVLDDLKRRFPNEPEYHQAVEEVLSTIEEEYNKHPEFDKVNLIERLCIPDRVYHVPRDLDG